MSDEFFRKTFGDTEPVHLGSGWVSGVSAVFLGLLGLAPCCACASRRF